MADDTQQRMKINVREILQRYFLAGLLVFLPVVITLWFLGWVIGLMDGLLDVLDGLLYVLLVSRCIVLVSRGMVVVSRCACDVVSACPCCCMVVVSR